MIVSPDRESKTLMTPKICSLIRYAGAIDWYIQNYPCVLRFSFLVVLPKPFLVSPSVSSYLLSLIFSVLYFLF